MSAAPVPDDAATLARLKRGLRMVTVPFPHLAGLAAAVRVAIDRRVPTMGVFASGRLVANPEFTAKLDADGLVFVLAHELLHLALRTHDRARGSAHVEFNYAHDYIINDMLRDALEMKIPAGGLDMPGARSRSAEEIVLEMRRSSGFLNSRSRVWDGTEARLGDALGAAGEDAGDVLGPVREREMFPADAEGQEARARAIRDLARKGMAMGRAIGAMRARGTEPGGVDATVTAQRGVFRTPWQLALQTWLDGTAPGERTYTRASRRGADSDDTVLPGRKRYTWRLNIVLDTSGSMSEDVAPALGAIAQFCDAAGVDEIRLVQCDTVVTSDETLSPLELGEYTISGYGGSDLTPALAALAEDSLVTAALVITDGDVAYPGAALPYGVLWALPRANASFQPPYGRVVTLDNGAVS